MTEQELAEANNLPTHCPACGAGPNDDGTYTAPRGYPFESPCQECRRRTELRLRALGHAMAYAREKLVVDAVIGDPKPDEVKIFRTGPGTQFPDVSAELFEGAPVKDHQGKVIGHVVGANKKNDAIYATLQLNPNVDPTKVPRGLVSVGYVDGETRIKSIEYLKPEDSVASVRIIEPEDVKPKCYGCGVLSTSQHPPLDKHGRYWHSKDCHDKYTKGEV